MVLSIPHYWSNWSYFHFSCGFTAQESSSMCRYSFHCMGVTPSSQTLVHPTSPIKQWLTFPLHSKLPRNISSLSCFSLCGSLQGLTFLWGACGKRTLCRWMCCLCQWNCQVQNNQVLFCLFYSPISLLFHYSSVCTHLQKASGNNCYLKLRSINIADLLMFNYR